jgi:hypothetical protein
MFQVVAAGGEADTDGERCNISNQLFHMYLFGVLYGFVSGRAFRRNEIVPPAARTKFIPASSARQPPGQGFAGGDEAAMCS